MLYRDNGTENAQYYNSQNSSKASGCARLCLERTPVFPGLDRAAQEAFKAVEAEAYNADRRCMLFLCSLLKAFTMPGYIHDNRDHPPH